MARNLRSQAVVAAVELPVAVFSWPLLAELNIGDNPRIEARNSCPCGHCGRSRLPAWTKALLLPARPTAASAKYLLTFKPFGMLPAPVLTAYLAGNLHLLPFPGSLLYWGVPGYRRLAGELPHALQIPLISGMARHRMPGGLRVPQSGYLHEPTPRDPHARHHTSQIHNTYKRTHRWDKILRDQDELALIGKEDKLLHVLFSTLPDDLTLYDKPMARNVQLWTDDYRLLLDGPNATPEQLKHGNADGAIGRPVRLPLPLPGDAGRPARGLLAPGAGRVSRGGRGAEGAGRTGSRGC